MIQVGHLPADTPPSRIINRMLTFADDCDAVLNVGPLVVSFKRLALAIRDPRVQRHHLRVLVHLMERLNYETGTAFPSRKTIAADESLSVRTVDNACYHLRNWGYLSWEQRAAPRVHRGRLLHYTIPAAQRSEEEIRAEIETFLKDRRGAQLHAGPGSSQLHAGPCSQGSLLHSGAGNQLHSGACDSNLLKGTDEKSAARAKNSSGRAQGADEALLLYNESARRHGWSVCQRLTDSRRKRLERRLADIGGIDQFALALSAIPNDDFLMGRTRPRDGGKAFRLDLERLLSDGSNMGDVLARLIDAAMDAQGNGAAHGVEAEVARLAALPMGQSMIREKGRETALAELRELVLSRTESAHAQ